MKSGAVSVEPHKAVHPVQHVAVSQRTHTHSSIVCRKKSAENIWNLFASCLRDCCCALCKIFFFFKSVGILIKSLCGTNKPILFCNTHTCLHAVKCTDAQRQRQCTHRCCWACQDFGFSFLTVVSPCVSTVWKTLSLSAALLFCVHRALGENKIQTSVGEKIPRRKRENRKIVLKELSSWKFGEEKQTSQETVALKILFFFLFCLSAVINKQLHSFLKIVFSHVSENVQNMRGEKNAARVLALAVLLTDCGRQQKKSQNVGRSKKKKRQRVDWERSNLSPERRKKKKINKKNVCDSFSQRSTSVGSPFLPLPSGIITANWFQLSSAWQRRPILAQHQHLTRVGYQQCVCDGSQSSMTEKNDVTFHEREC